MSDINVTKGEFERFVEVQRSGVVNMVSSEVQDLACISKDTHMLILNHYKELETQFTS